MAFAIKSATCHAMGYRRRCASGMRRACAPGGGIGPTASQQLSADIRAADDDADRALRKLRRLQARALSVPREIVYDESETDPLWRWMMNRAAIVRLSNDVVQASTDLKTVYDKRDALRARLGVKVDDESADG